MRDTVWVVTDGLTGEIVGVYADEATAKAFCLDRPHLFLWPHPVIKTPPDPGDPRTEESE